MQENEQQANLVSAADLLKTAHLFCTILAGNLAGPKKRLSCYPENTMKSIIVCVHVGGCVSDRAVQVQALAGIVALCSWLRHFTPTVPLLTKVFEWVLVNLVLGVTPIQGGSRNTPSHFMQQKPR